LRAAAPDLVAFTVIVRGARGFALLVVIWFSLSSLSWLYRSA
jgi:hypothetical protein